MTGDFAPLEPEATAALAQLVQRLRETHRDAISGVLLYGSCLRSGDVFDGLVDLYLVCDRYRAAYARRSLVWSNWLLPPNVFYVEFEHEGRTLRSKYAVISMADFRIGCSKRTFESYVWGRFAQPASILYARDPSTRVAMEQCLLTASSTFLERTAPCLPATGTVPGLWRDALALSYGSELRAERSGRAAELVNAFLSHYENTTRQLQPKLSFPLTVYAQQGELHYRTDIARSRRATSKLAWRLRRGQGKLFSVLRLLKGLFTFDGGIDYVAWKLTRHTGRQIVVPERVRRFPLLFLWGFFWRLYRQGVFR
jgi:hypothetical protein